MPKKKKIISKIKYENLFENNIIYRYEDNPEEYKRVRKRIQNRHSATRVRSRKKNNEESQNNEIDLL